MNTSLQVRKGFSLRAKLVLSYLGVALGAILLMVIVVTIAVQQYFYQSQMDQLKNSATAMSSEISEAYQNNHNSWINLTLPVPIYDIRDLPIILTTQNQYLSTTPNQDGLVSQLISNNTLKQALQSSLQGQSEEGSYQIDGNPDSLLTTGFYASAPITLNNQIIGSVLLIEPTSNQRKGFNPTEFLTNVNTVILIAGAGIALLVVLFSLFMARVLTRPLISLTRVAEGMKAGNFALRVEQPGSQDELGQLALTFNSMADKIAADVNALRIQEQLRRDLIANIAHDLVTPLTAIQGYSEAIADNVISEPGQRQETALLIGREVQRLRRLVSDMQNMTALEAGRVQLELAPLNMHDLVEETLAVITPECEQARITLRNEISPTTPLALADSDRIAQVLLNLLDNARRHTPVGGQITLGASPQGQVLIVWVKDTGVGIHPQDLPYIFERFYRVDRSRSAASGGSGLGLAIIKAIVNGHGGTTWAQSAPDQGTTILFTLPLALAPNRQLTSSAPSDKPLPSPTKP